MTEHSNKVKKIAILTSGGDAPGMNNIISGVYRSITAINLARKNNEFPNSDKRPIELLLIKDGYKGLLQKEIYQINDYWKHLINISTRMGGTIIGSSRYKEFEQEETRKKAKKILDEYEIESLICVGGDGTFKGLKGLNDLGIKCVGIPGTIDNDVVSTQWTVGFDTALNTIVKAIDNIRETSDSHSRIAIIETMGRECGDLAIQAGINCDVISTPEKKIEESELVSIVKDLHKINHLRSILVLVTEGLYDVKKLAKKIEEETKVETRATVLSAIQRGGTPSAWDRYLATMMGQFAVDQVNKNEEGSVIIALEDNKLIPIPVQNALNIPRKNKVEKINRILLLSGIRNKK